MHSSHSTGDGEVVENVAAQYEFEITFTLAAGYDEDDACELLDYIEGHKAVSGAALSGRFGEHVERYEPDA